MNSPAALFTVDVEEYYHAENVCRSVPESVLKGLPDRVGVGVERILDLLACHGSTGTFFVLGCVAEKNKALVRKIVDAGHEIASHGYLHTPLSLHTAESFDADLGRSISVLQDISGEKVRGYRATSFSLGPGCRWFFDVLRKHGVSYDSSVARSFFRPQQMVPAGSRGAFEISPGVTEIPVSSLSCGPLRLPVGGGYFRAYPLWMTEQAADLAAKDGVPFVFYLHPWELDPDQPRCALPWLKSVRHYIGLTGAAEKLSALLGSRRFTSIGRYLDGWSRV